MYFVSNFLKGILIGTGAILPGISSGVICMVTGIYEKLLNSILNFFKDTKENIKFLLSIGLGAILGCVFFSNLLVYFFTKFPTPTKSLFGGLLLGSLWLLYKKESSYISATSKAGNFSFLVCFILGTLLIILENKVDISLGYFPNEYNALFLILSGFFMSMGIVIPRS